MTDVANPRPAVNGQSKTNGRTRAEFYRGIDIMRRRVLVHPKATLSAVRIIELLPETTFNFERWQATGFYDAGGQPDGYGISEETIAELCGITRRSVKPAMKLLARVLGMRVRNRQRDFATQRFEGAKAYHFPTPQETRANAQGLRSGFSEDNALTDNENRERDFEPKSEPTCRANAQGLRTNLSSNLSRKKDSAANAAAPLEEGAQESGDVGHVNGQASTTATGTDASAGKSDVNGRITESAAQVDPQLARDEARLAECKTKLAEFEAAPESQFKDPRDRGFEIARLKSSIYILNSEVSARKDKGRLHEELRRHIAHFGSGDGMGKAREPGGVDKLKRAVRIAKEVGRPVEVLSELLANVDPNSAPVESERALYALVQNIPNIKNPGALAASLIKAHGDNVCQARKSFNDAVKREPRSLERYLWKIVRNETKERNRSIASRVII
jgi:hypothetical protein